MPVNSRQKIHLWKWSQKITKESIMVIRSQQIQLVSQIVTLSYSLVQCLLGVTLLHIHWYHSRAYSRHWYQSYHHIILSYISSTMAYHPSTCSFSAFLAYFPVTRLCQLLKLIYFLLQNVCWQRFDIFWYSGINIYLQNPIQIAAIRRSQSAQHLP